MKGRYMLALARIAVGVIFLFFAQYKLFQPGFVHGGFEKYVRGYYDKDMPIRSLRPTLEKYVLPHPQAWGRIVGWSEPAIALSLILGLWVRAASIGGAIYMLALTLTTWYAPGHDAPKWRYIGANLDHIPLLILFLIFLATDAGTMCGMDSRRGRSGAGAAKKKSSRPPA